MYADDTVNAVEKEIPHNPQPAPSLGKLTKDGVLQCYSDLFRPGRGSPLGTSMHIELYPNVRPVTLLCIYFVLRFTIYARPHKLHSVYCHRA